MTEPSPEKKVPRILICEDEIVIARDLARTLKNLGYEIAGMASTGNQAVRIAEESRTDLILMDINLDGEIDGIETTEQIRAKLDVPVVYLTGYAEKDVLERAKKTRPYGYLAKPCGLLELRSTIETALYKHEADRRVRESEERLRSSWETLHDFVFVVNSEGVFTDYHQPPDLQKLYAPPHEFLGRNYRDVLPQDVARSLREAINAVQQRDSVALFDYPMVISGQKEWFSAKVSKRKSHSGEFAGVTIVCRDITDRKHAEEALRERESLIRSVSNNLPSGMIYQVVRNNDGSRKFTYLSQAVKEFYGCSPEEALNDATLIYGRVFEEDRHRVFAEEEESHRTYSDFTTEVRMINPSGDIRWSYFASSPRRLEDGSTCWSGFEIDITERKKTESALRETAARLAKAEELAHIGSWEWNVQTGTLVWSDESFRAFGYDHQETERLGHATKTRISLGNIGLSLDLFVESVHPDDRDAIHHAIVEALAGREPYDIEFRIVRPDGDIRVLHSRGDVLRTDAGLPIKMIGMAVDVTERRIAENLLLAQRDLSLALSGVSTLDEAFTLCLETATHVSGMEAACIYLVSPDSSLDLVAHQGLSERFLERTSHFPGFSAEAQTVSAASPVFGRCDDADLPELPKQALQEEGFLSWAVIPILHRSRVICSIHLASRRFGEIPAKIRTALQGIASGLGTAVTRIRAEEALRVSEELYRVLVETTNTGYVVVDGEGRVLAANPEYVRLTGHDTREEILGRSVVEWTAEHDRERNAAEVEKCLREGVVRNLEIDYMDPNGGLVPIEVNATVVDGSDGRRIMSICREISDRRKSEQSVNAQRDLGVALSGVSDLQEAFALCIGTAVQISGMELAGIYVVEEDSGFHLVAHHGLSREFLRKVEYFPEESPEARIVATGSPVYYCGHHPEMSFSVIEALRGEGLRAGAVIPVVHQGEIVASLALCSRTFDEVPAHTRTALETISSQIGAALSRIRAESAVRKVKEELQESELRYREVVDLANEGIVVVQNGTMVLANRKAGEVTGRSGDELLATPILDMIHPDDRELLLDQHKMRMRGFSGPVEYTFRILGKAGDLRWLQMRTSLISWGGRNATLGLLSDITHSKRLEEELRESLTVASRLRVEAEAASTAKSEFLATMSHELRTPLNAIIGFSELLEAQAFGDLNDKQMDSVTEVLSAGHRLLDLINDVLDLAKVESGRMELEISSVNLSELLRDCLSLIAGEAVRKRIVIDLSVDETMGDSDVRIDGGKVRQVVCNLLSNAVKFTPKGGRIGVEAVKDRGDLLVSVSDTGIGIRPEDRQQIFQKFVQLDSTLSRRYKGTGLGLALSRTFVELQGGRIWFESEGLGQGSTFRFRIPLCGNRPVEHPGQADMAITDAREEPESAMQPCDMTPASPRKILVVEDDPASMKLVAGILEAHGYEVLRATDAEVGIRLAETQAPALILMDVSLPGLDGIAATRSLKQGPGTRDIPIIAVTAHAMKGDEERIRSEGCDGYLPKPIAHKALLAMVEKHLTQ